MDNERCMEKNSGWFGSSDRDKSEEMGEGRGVNKAVGLIQELAAKCVTTFLDL